MSNDLSNPNPLIPRRRRGFWGRPAQARPPIPWLWHGYLAGGQVTLLTAQWKSGKTTLLSLLLARMKTGGDFAGLPLAQARAVVVSEESEDQWAPRLDKFDLSHVYLICRPFTGIPTQAEWLDLIDEIADTRQSDGAAIVAFDTLPTFLPGCEANAASVLKALLPLQRLTQAGMSVLLTHHPKKGVVLPGQAARGSGAFAGFADVVLEMTRCPCARDDDRRRRLLAFSRSDATPRQRVFELNQEATDYTCLGDFLDDDFAVNWQRLRLVLEDAGAKLSRRDILEQWPPDYPCPGDSTLWNWLERAVALGQLCREGSGRRADPFRYWLAEKEKTWRQDPVHELMERLEREGAMMRQGL